jgi:AsmA-like C-terminal region/AsmA family
MRISQKRILLGLAALVAILGILVQSFNSLASRNREQVQQELQKVLGKDVSFERLKVSLLGGFGFSAKGFRISDDPRFAATPLVQANDLILGVSFWDLLLGRIVIVSMTLKQPEFQIITNEAGVVNLSALASRKKELGTFPRFRLPTAERHRAAVNFLVSRIRVENGRIAYVDRSIKEPAEVQIRNVDMDVEGLDPKEQTRFKLTAALTEGLARDVRIDGLLGPMIDDRSWLQQPIDLNIKFDSLYVPLLARTVAFLRDKIPRELDVTGPMALQMKITGPLGSPRISNFTLKVPLFGSTDYNAVVNGSIDLTTRNSWSEAPLKGKLTLDRIDLKQLGNLSFFEQILPASFSTEGGVNVYSRFEGTWSKLRIGALVRADRAEFRYRNWLRKPAGTTTRLQLRVSRQKNGLIFYPAVLRIGGSQLSYSGAIEDLGAPQLQLRFFSARSHLAPWSHLFSTLPVYAGSGVISWDIVVSKNLVLPGESWDARGSIKVTGARLREKGSSRKIDNLNAEIFFSGRQVRLQSGSFRLGSSKFTVAITAPDMHSLKASYEIRSPDLDLSDLTAAWSFASARLRNVTATGAIQMEKGFPLLTGIVSSPQGNLKQTVYRNLRAEVSWSPTATGFKNLSLQVFNGTFHSDAYWVFGSEQNHAFEVTSEIEAMDAQSALAELMPKLRNRLRGQLNFRGKLATVKTAASSTEDAIEGSGEASIHNGAINDFNLFTQLLTRGGERSPGLKLSARLPEIVAQAVQRRDTPFDTLKANFVVAEARLRIDSFRLSTPDYTVTGAGWVGFDRTMKWNGSLVLSPPIAQALEREYKTLRYLLDRRGTLAISFRIEGTLPNIKIKPENRALAQLLRLISSERSDSSSAGSENKSSDRNGSQWLPESLDRLLRR